MRTQLVLINRFKAECTKSKESDISASSDNGQFLSNCTPAPFNINTNYKFTELYGLLLVDCCDLWTAEERGRCVVA